MDRELRALDPPLSTAAWYGDLELPIALPATWDVTVHWPRPPEPLSDEGIAAAIENPVGQPALRTLASGRRRVVIVVDDLSRPTPADRILPHLLGELAAAGIDDAAISVVIATGTHGRSRAGVERKLGADTARRLRTTFHDDVHGCVRLGTTSFGSPVAVNRRVAEADLVIGIGGIYPQHSVGFGGGAKIVLGVLGRRSIERLHYRHPSVEGRFDLPSSFRADVAEMAALAGLEVSVGAMVDARRRLCWLRVGDPAAYFAPACADAVRYFSAPGPGDADVVIANAYPMDLSATFVRSKGLPPLTRAAPGASRILIGAASEGIGHHGLFPLDGGRSQALMGMLRTARNRSRRDVAMLARRRLVGTIEAITRRAPATATPPVERNPVIFHPTAPPSSLPPSMGGMRTEASWERILEAVEREQGGRTQLRAVVYPCGPLQVLEG